MADAASSRTASLAPLKPWRLPLVAVVGALTMGSGWGNPGCSCGSDFEAPPCDAGCDTIVGRYQLTFEDTGPLRGGCEELGQTLPAELVLTRKGDALTSSVQGAPLGGYFVSDANVLSLQGVAPVKDARGEQVMLHFVVSGEFTPVPSSATESATWKGTYRVDQWSEGGAAGACSILSGFTATR